MAQDPSSLNEFRASIDEIDNEIHLLINRRAKIAQLIGQVKKDHEAILNQSKLIEELLREEEEERRKEVKKATKVKKNTSPVKKSKKAGFKKGFLN